jgi:hypothetical protein
MASEFEKAGDRVDKSYATGESAPPWLPATEARVRQEIEKLEQEAQLRLAKRTTPPTEADRLAAESLKRAKQNFTENKAVPGHETYARYAKAFEVFLALGIRGQGASTTGTGEFKRGYLGTLPEIRLSTEEEDVHEGFDFVVIIPTNAGEIRLGVDATFSSKKFDHKFGRLHEGVKVGVPTGTHANPSRRSGVLRVVVGISNEAMKRAIREWGRTTDRVEAWDRPDIGARIYEQMILQLDHLAVLAEKYQHNALANQYRVAAAKLRSLDKLAAKGEGLENDEIHLAIKKYTKELLQS